MFLFLSSSPRFSFQFTNNDSSDYVRWHEYQCRRWSERWRWWRRQWWWTNRSWSETVDRSRKQRKSRRSIRRYHCVNKDRASGFVKNHQRQQIFLSFFLHFLCKDLLFFFNGILRSFLFLFRIRKKDNYNGGAQQNLRERNNQAGAPSSSTRSRRYHSAGDEWSKSDVPVSARSGKISKTWWGR